MVYALDGTVRRTRVSYAYRFDAALVSRSGQLVALYERLGTKAVIVDATDASFVREIDRRFYQAHVYEFPIAFVTLPDGTEGLAHCPREYCRLDVEDARTGRCLTDSVPRKPSDCFHSRLLQSPGGRWLASAGWMWHPVDVGGFWDFREVLANPKLLDEFQAPVKIGEEVASLTFMDDDTALVATGEDADDDEKVGDRLILVDPRTGLARRDFPLLGPAGTVHRISSDRVISFLPPHQNLWVDRLGSGRWPS